MRIAKWSPVRVEWIDSSGATGWHDPPEGGWEMGCVTVGMFFERTDECVTVIGSRDESSGRVMASLSIPLGCVKSIKRLQ